MAGWLEFKQKAQPYWLEVSEDAVWGSKETEGANPEKETLQKRKFSDLHRTLLKDVDDLNTWRRC